MARYQLSGPWPVGDRLIPTASIIDDAAGDDDYSKLVRARNLPPPINAVPLTQETFNQMAHHYGDHARWIVTGPEIRR